MGLSQAELSAEQARAAEADRPAWPHSAAAPGPWRNLRFPLPLNGLQGPIKNRGRLLPPPSRQDRPNSQLDRLRSRQRKACFLMPWARIGTQSEWAASPSKQQSLADASGGAPATRKPKAVAEVKERAAWQGSGFSPSQAEKRRGKGFGPFAAAAFRSAHRPRSKPASGSSPSLAPWSNAESAAGSELGQ